MEGLGQHRGGGGHGGGHAGGGAGGGHAPIHRAPPAAPQHGPSGHPGPHPHHPHDHGHGHGWGGWGWGGGWWSGDWFPVFIGVTEEQVSACSWQPYQGQAPSVIAKAQGLRLRQGEVQFYRFPDAPGIFEFYLGQDGRVRIDHCDDGVVGVGAHLTTCTSCGGSPEKLLHPHRPPPAMHMAPGLGQNYLWDRYPGEIEPDEGAHTGTVGLAGCGDGHHPACDWESGACYCDVLAWGPPERFGRCTTPPPNPGSSHPHLRAGHGPPGNVGMGQTVNPDGTITQGDITYTPPTSGPSTQGWTPGEELPPASPSPPGVQPGSGSWGPYPTTVGQATTAPLAAAQVSGPAAATSGSTGMLVGGVVALVAGLGGIIYLAHMRA